MTPFSNQSLSQYIQDDVPAPVIDRGEEAPFSGKDFRSDQVGFLRAGTSDSDPPWKVITNFVAWVQTEVVYPENPDLDHAEVFVRGDDGRIDGPRKILLRRLGRPDEWVISDFGIRNRVYPGVRKDVLLNAIQVASGTPSKKVAYDRLGVVYSPDGEARFLTGDGAISSSGKDTSIQVDGSPILNRYSFMPAESVDDERAAMRAVLEVLSEVPKTDRGATAVIVLLAAAFRAPLFAARPVRFMISVVGETGSGKSGLASLILNLFGKDFAHDRLPTSWNSTGVSLLGLMTHLVHVMLVIDNYVEKPGPGGAYQRSARNLVSMAIGDGAVRGASNRDGTRRPDRDIGALVVSTQEQMGIDQQSSETARQVVIKLEKRMGETPDVSIEAMEALQLKYGHTGVLSSAMYGYINRFLSGIGSAESDLQSAFASAHAHLKNRTGPIPHERIGRNVAELMIGWNAMVAYAQELGVFDADCPHTAESLHALASDAFVDLVKAQVVEQNDERPEEVVLELLREALKSRKVSLRDRQTDGKPVNPALAGWEERSVKAFGGGVEYVPAHHQIGWIDDDFIYLQPNVTYAALAEIARKAEITIPVGQRQLGTTLRRGGISEPGHGERPTRKEQVGSQKAWVIKIHRKHVVDESAASDSYEDEQGNVVEIRRSA